MVCCFVPDCKHYYGKYDCIFFSFPKDERERNVWIRNISRQDKEPTKNSRVCNCHFKGGCKSNGPTVFFKRKVISFESPEKKRRKARAVANASADGASSSYLPPGNSVNHSYGMMEKNGGNISSEAVENEEVITPDLDMQCSERMDVNKSSASTSFLSNSGIVVKQEIIETELESNVFDDPSFHSSFTDGPSETQFDGQRPSTSCATHSESSNSNTDILPGRQPYVVATTPTLPHGLRTVKMESDVSSNSCGVIPEKNGAPSIVPSILNVTDPEISTRDESIPSRVPHPILNAAPDNSLSNEQIKLGVSSHIGPPSLPQDFNSVSQTPSHSSLPFRPRDRFDAFGEFVALKLRNLDPKSSVFVQTTFADLILKAELRMFSNKNEKSVTQTDDIGKDTPPVNAFENTNKSSEKENIHPKIPSRIENPHLPPDFNTTDPISSSRNETLQHRVPYHTPNTSFPPLVNNTDSENSLRNDFIQPSVMYHIKHPFPSVSNVTIPEITSINCPNQTTVSSHTVGTSVSPILNTTNSLCNTPIQPRVPFHTRSRDEFDIYGEFAASKLRNLDLRSCAFVQTAFADLIFKAELGKFVNESEQSFFCQQNELSGKCSI